jgi:hypothetical protein
MACTCSRADLATGRHRPNCPYGSARAATGADRGDTNVETAGKDLKPTAKEMRQDWYPKDQNGKPVPGNKLSEYEKALLLSGGDNKNIVMRKGHAYVKKVKRKG